MFFMCVYDADINVFVRSLWGKPIESLSGKVVWITGASSGIGEHIAYQLASVGCKLVLSARRKEELERVKQTCLMTNRGTLSDDDILVLPLDIIKFESHKSAVKQVLDHFKKIDILINNAGRFQQAWWTDIDLEVDRHIFELNVLGPVSLTQAVLPHMIERKAGQIAVMSSLAGITAAPGSRSYCGSKHALHGYYDVLRFELCAHNIDVTIICPGPVKSELLTNAVTGKKEEPLKNHSKIFRKQMSTERCAYLSCLAIANRMYEVWISIPPFVLFTFGMTYLATFSKWMCTTPCIRRFFNLPKRK
nr:dehydrogenase/reductase SDR family member 7-like; partial [Biomphalaria glabrata]